MKKFNVKVFISQEYEIEIDDTILNDEWKENFEKYFWDLPDEHKSVAEHIATKRAIGTFGFMEGFGPIKVNGEAPYPYKEEDMVNGLNIIIISENEEIEADIEELGTNKN